VVEDLVEIVDPEEDLVDILKEDQAEGQEDLLEEDQAEGQEDLLEEDQAEGQEDLLEEDLVGLVVEVVPIDTSLTRKVKEEVEQDPQEILEGAN